MASAGTRPAGLGLVDIGESGRIMTQDLLSLSSVLILFVADLPWYASRLNADKLPDRERGSIEDFRVFFRHEAKQMTMLLKPDREWNHLTESSAQELVERLSQVMRLLESKVDDDVFEVCNRKLQAGKGPHSEPVVSSTLFWAASKIFRFARATVSSFSAGYNPGPAPDAQCVYPKLKALKLLLEDLGSSGDPVFKFGNLIDLGNSRDDYKSALPVLEQFNHFLECLDNTRPVNKSVKASEWLIPPATKAEIQKAQDASRALFDAFACCSTECGEPHQAMLHLTGFKQPAGEDLTRPMYHMFLSCCSTRMETSWHEAQCFITDPADYPNATRLVGVCPTVREYRASQEILRVILGGKTLYDAQFTGACLEKPLHTASLSLAQLLDKGYFKSAYEGGLFTPRSKRALVLNLARCLLCLFGSKWLQREWEAVDLAFLCGAENQAKRLVDMHRPYVLGSLSHTAYCVDFVRRSSSVPHHPAVLSFAKLLVDIERGRRITEEEFQLSDGQHNEWLTISTIVTTKLSGSLTEHYTTAIQSCLDFARMERRQANETDSDYIYRNIVLPLQKELSDYPMSHIENVELQLPVTSPEELGAVPKAIPVGSQAPHSPRSPSQRPLFLSTRIETYRTPDVVFFDDFECGGRDDNASHSKAITDQPLIERSIKERSIKFLKLLDDWMEQRIEKLKVKGTGPVSGSTATATEPCLIKVAILDTGLDRSNATFIKARRYIRSNHSRQDDPVKEVKSFIHEGGEGQDVDGHGTLTTTLILKAAPWANLYVAKIASGRTTGECDAIAKAIEEASDKTKWNVDIIVMPFSVERHSDAVKNALNNAYHRGKILIASAANSGGLSGRAYPAKDERVICMHASDGMGNDSNGTNPSALSRVDNFTTLGLGIEFSQAGKRVWKSGTSYSAPIAAGIAASILHVIGHPANEGEMSPEQLSELRTVEGIRKTFRLIANDNVRDGYDFIGPWNLWKSTLSESDVCSIIKQQLTR